MYTPRKLILGDPVTAFGTLLAFTVGPTGEVEVVVEDGVVAVEGRGAVGAAGAAAVGV